MTDLQRALRANLKGFRRQRGWSQSELAERAEVSVSYVGDLETGAKWPRPEVIERLASAFTVRPYELFMEGGDALAYQAWLEKRDVLAEFSEELLRRFEKRAP